MSGRNHHRKRGQCPPDRAGRVLRRPVIADTPMQREAVALMGDAALARACELRVVALRLLPRPRLIAVSLPMTDRAQEESAQW